MSKKVLILSVIFIVLVSIVGCGRISEITYSEIKIEDASSKLTNFINDSSKKNGVHIFENDNKELYIFLNGYNVFQGEKAPYFENIKIEVQEDSLIISFTEKYTDDYSDKNIKNKVLYKVKKHKDFEYIRVYKNNQEVQIDSVWG